MKKTNLFLSILALTFANKVNATDNNVNNVINVKGFNFGVGMELKAVGKTIDIFANNAPGVPGAGNGSKYSNELIDTLYITPSIKVGYIYTFKNNFVVAPEFQFNIGDSNTRVYKLKLGYALTEKTLFNIGFGSERGKVILAEGAGFNGYTSRFILEPELLYFLNNKSYVNFSIRFGQRIKSSYIDMVGKDKAQVNYNITNINVGYNIVF